MAQDINLLANLLGVELNPSRRFDVDGVKSILERLNIFSQKWRLMDNVKTIGMLTLYFTAWSARMLLIFLPQRMDVCGITNALEFLGNDAPRARFFDSEEDHARIKSSGAVGRALMQVLSLVNDLPASSMKYEFARDLAEKIISDNERHGQGFETVNRVALSAGFHRTLTILHESLAGLHQQNRIGNVWSLPMKMIRMLPSAGMALPLPAPLSHVRSTIGGFLSPIVQSGNVYQSSRVVYDVNGSLMADKLAQELLWLAQKLSECSALEEGINLWSSSHMLASVAVTANPRVQRSLVRLSALFVQEIAKRKVEVTREVKFKLLLHWIPLFCAATHGADGVIFNTLEKAQAERTLDQAIRSLPESDQEVLLAIWLQEYALSPSDWPDLRNCYHGWCQRTRELGHHAPAAQLEG